MDSPPCEVSSSHIPQSDVESVISTKCGSELDDFSDDSDFESRLSQLLRCAKIAIERIAQLESSQEENIFVNFECELEEIIVKLQGLEEKMRVACQSGN